MNALLQVMTAYAVATVALLVLDLLWLRVVTRPRRQKGLGMAHLLGGARRRGSVGLLLYAFFALGLLVLTLRPLG